MRICLHDPDTIGAFLSRNPGLHLYQIGDLDPFFWPHTTWYGWQGPSGLEALAMLYSGDELPVLLALGDAAPLQALLVSLKALLPTRFYSHLSPGLEAALAPEWALTVGELHYRMLLTQPDKLADYECPEAVVLTQADLPLLEALYSEAYPHNWFNARMLETGQYMGIRRENSLLAVAGVHVYSPARSVAALGNITVHPQARDKGWGTRLTAALCRRLHETVETIGLNVHADNAAALKCYARLGFEICAEYREWMATGAP